MRQQLEVAIRHSLAAQARNRLAWVLLVVFVPGWYLLIGSMIGHAGAPFVLRATGTVLVVDGHELTLITAGLSAITLITGFVVFAATRRALPFDRRLVLSGYRPGALIAAKTTAALAVAAAVGAYRRRHAARVLAAIRAVGRRSGVHPGYGDLCRARAAHRGAGPRRPGRLLPHHHDRHAGHLPGKPGGQPAGQQADPGVLRLPRPTQFAAAGAFHHQALAGMAAVSLAWTAAFALLGLAVLRLRMPHRTGWSPAPSRAGGGALAA